MTKKLTKIIISITTLIVILSLLWFRFFRERLPRDIPFTLSFVSFVLLFILCVSYAYAIKKILAPKNSNSFINSIVVKVISYPYKLVEKFVLFISEYPRTRAYFKNYIGHFIAYFEKVSFAKSELGIRFIIVTCLLVDTFYFYKLNYFYKTIILGIFLLLLKLLLHVFKVTMNKNTKAIDERAEIYVTNIIDHPPMLFPAEDFVIMRKLTKLLVKIKLDYLPKVRLDYLESERKRLNLPDTSRFSNYAFCDSIYNSINLVSFIYEILFKYDREKEKFNYINLAIYLLHFISWTYILFTSIHTLNITIIMSCLDIMEPFSDLPIASLNENLNIENIIKQNETK